MSHPVERPLSVGYVVSYFHPFASGAERQALAQGLELVRRGHRVHVITRSVPGYPIDDEEYQGIFIHRWVRTWNRGPLFGLSFVSGVRRALRRLRGELDVIHTHQALWEAVATGLAGRPAIGDSHAGAAGQLGLLRRGRRAPAHPGIARPAADHPAEHGVRGHLGGDRTPVARARRAPRPAGPDRKRRGHRSFSPGPQPGGGRSSAPPARGLHGAHCTLRRTCRSCSKPGPRSPARPRPT